MADLRASESLATVDSESGSGRRRPHPRCGGGHEPECR